MYLNNFEILGELMNSEKYIMNIRTNLAMLETQIKLDNAIGLFNSSILSEDFYAKFLNLVYDYNLVNLNLSENNFPSIDLGDTNRRLAFQVSSDSSSTKIKKTIKKFNEHKLYEKFDKLKFIFLINKKSYTKEFVTENKFDFKIKEDILDARDLMKKIKTLSTEKMKEIDTFLNKELSEKMNRFTIVEANEVETIIDLIELLTSYKKYRADLNTFVDPDFKINNRFKDYAQKIITDFTSLLPIYGDIISYHRPLDQIEEILVKMYLQDKSIEFLENHCDDPIKALESLVNYFEEKMSSNSKKYDKAAIKFFLINETIKCSVFPNERL